VVLNTLPGHIESEEELDEFLTRPSPALVEFIKTVRSPLVILGAGGKMGPTLAVLAKQAAVSARYSLEVIAVSRFGDERARAWLEARDVRTIACDLLNRSAVAKLPGASHLIYLVGLKFGTAQNPAATWAVNTLVPSIIAERYPQARIASVSTGNVYPLSPVSSGGSLETDPLTPVGEYANAAVGRERIFDYYSRRGNFAVALLRLFYAVELRYGVLVDIAQRVKSGEAIDLTNGVFNCIWQGDANEMILRSVALAASPASTWNLCRPEAFGVRDVAKRLGELLGCAPKFVGAESSTALLGNAQRICAALRHPIVTLDHMLRWIAAWVARGGRNLEKPTHFEVRDGTY
jgi:hypothetical protein